MIIVAPYLDRWTVRSSDTAVSLRGYGLPVNFLFALDSARWDLLGSVVFRWNAYEASLRDPSQYGAALLIGRKYSDKLRLRYGIYANREYFEAGVYDFARAELEFPGWLSQLLTHPVTGLENYQEMMSTLTMEKNAIKVFVNVTPH